ncbi:restriction endonuclease subunit S [Algibacter sp. L4_22]|uniref:restriction endonuclease subunit S n=1 Tax=Algibacter sp. L4_22 TaxID=2942477 RepID=UPI00201B5D98|nr:restriction endonuclease subunit S [Algibacter sp. L4_22]MCL5129337.1 restriction endonuclease subunit S [Algibacter sp. L4_22]
MEKTFPKNWVETNVSEYLINYDNQRKPISSKERESRKGDFPYFGATGKIDNIDGFTHDGEFVLIGEDGANLLTRVKPLAFLVAGKIWVNNHAHVLSSGNTIQNKLFTFYFNSLDISEFVSGSAQPKLNQKNLGLIPIKLPPLAEQQRIVAKLDELFGHLDSLKTRLNNIPQILKNFRQAVLTQAVTGKLTEEWRVGKELEDVNEYSENLIEYKKQIYIQQMEKWKLESKENTVKLKKPSKPKILPEVEDWENEFSVIIPENWKFVRFNHVTAKIGDVDHKMPKNIDVGVPYLSTGNMKDVNNLDFENSRKISRDDYMILSSKIKPEKGDIIFPRYGTIGRNILIDFDREFLVSYSCAIVKNLYKLMNPKYVFLVSISPFIKQEISKHVVQTTQANIGIASIEKFLFPLCTLEEQTEIVKRVEHLFTKADAIETQYQSLKAKIDSLPQAILAKAFKGELVAQLDTDGSAEVLLEEIQKMKENMTKQSVKPRKKKKKKI